MSAALGLGRAIIDGLVQLENGGSRAVSLTRRGRAVLDKAKTPAL